MAIICGAAISSAIKLDQIDISRDLIGKYYPPNGADNNNQNYWVGGLI